MERRAEFRERGFVGPLPVLDPEACGAFLEAIRAEKVAPQDWEKGIAVTSRAFYELATSPAIVDVVCELLGPDVLLWGASIQRRGPGVAHPWHSDIETSDPAGRTVSVWIGLEGTTAESSLLVIARSHELGLTVQEARQGLGLTRGEATAERLVEHARDQDERSELVEPELTDGDALFFDGRLWHGSHNRSEADRAALLVQYASPDTPIRLPDLNTLDWPFRSLAAPRPPCLLIRGHDKAGVNRIVPPPSPPPAGSAPRMSSRIHPLALPLEPDQETGWKPYPIWRGSTADLRVSCHVSALGPGHSPHPPHRHAEEEVLIVLAGEVEITAEDEHVRLCRGDLVYYPAQFSHTLETVGGVAANYLMFKWTTDQVHPAPGLEFATFRAFAEEEPGEGFRPRVLFEGPTTYLRTLHCHTSTVTGGAGYEAHRDSHDVAMVIFEGEVETHGVRVEPHGVILDPAGELHGLRNPGDVPARYLVFEFHAR